MSLLEDLKTFVAALALGAVLTLSINYVVVNYTEGPAPARAAAQPAPSQPANRSYEAPTAAPKPDAGGSYTTYY
jgi:hypothetical protein